MKKSLSLGIISLFILSAVAPMTGGYYLKISDIKQPSNLINCKTLYVGGYGPGNYTKIQDAIDDAVDCDTVYVYDDSSPYYENVVINKTINLIGEDRDTTIINGGDNGDVVYVDANWVNISGFTIQNSGVEENDAGMNISSNSNKIKDSTISNNEIGILIWNSSSNTIIENNISSNKHGIQIWMDSYDNFIIDNIILNNHHRGIVLGKDPFYITIRGNKISNHSTGIYLYHSIFIFISDNIISDNYFGIYSFSTKSIVITRNTIKSNRDFSIIILWSIHNEIINNSITSNRWGIQLDESYCNTIKNNNINFNNKIGINLYESSGNTITDNNINFNNELGINLYESSSNIITDNNINFNNELGINIDGHNHCNTNRIYHNNFNKNGENAYDECDNIWDDGKYGNYWSDYKEKYPFAIRKLLKPWMWNTPYEISKGDNKDMCPLVKQWPNSKPKTITRNILTYNPVWLRFIDMFLILQRILAIF